MDDYYTPEQAQLMICEIVEDLTDEQLAKILEIILGKYVRIIC